MRKSILGHISNEKKSLAFDENKIAWKKENVRKKAEKAEDRMEECEKERERERDRLNR